MKSQNERIKRHLETRGSITQRQADMEHGIARLGARILELKRPPYNMNIESARIKVQNRYGETCHVAKYSLVRA